MISSGVALFIVSVLFFCTLQLGGYKFYQTPNMLPGFVGMPVNVVPHLGWGNATTASFALIGALGLASNGIYQFIVAK